MYLLGEYRLLVRPACLNMEVFSHSQQLFPLEKMKSSFLYHVTRDVSGI